MKNYLKIVKIDQGSPIPKNHQWTALIQQYAKTEVRENGRRPLKLASIYYIKGAVIICFLSVLLAAPVKAQVTVIPFALKWKYMHVKVQIATSDTLDLMFDSGATYTSIDSAVAERIGLSKLPHQPIDVGGMGGVQKNIMVPDQQIKTGNIKIGHIDAVIFNYKPFATTTNVPLDGVIGFDILNNFVTAINFDNKKISLFNAVKDVDTTGYQCIPFEFINGDIPHINASIKLPNGELLSGKVMFDLGAAISLLITADFNKYHSIKQKVKVNSAGSGMGIGLSFRSEQATVDAVLIKQLSISMVPLILVSDPESKGADGYMGILGIDIISRFNLIMDYANKRIYMKPNQSFNQQF